MKTNFYLLILIGLLCFVAGCTPAQLVVATPTSTFSIPTSADPTAVSTLTFAAASTLTPGNTQTPTRTSTPAPMLPVRENTAIPHALAVISAANASQIQELARYGQPVIFESLISLDGKRLFTSSADGITIYKIDTHQPIGWINVTPRPMLSRDGFHTFQVNSDGTRAAIFTTQDIRIVDDHNQILLIFSYPESTDSSSMISVSSDLKYAAFSNTYFSQNPSFEVWDLHENELVYQGNGLDFIFLGSSRLAVFNWHSIDIYDVLTQKKQSIEIQFQSYTGLIASPDGNYLCILGNKIEVWNVPDARRMRAFSFPIHISLNHVKFSADSQRIAFLIDNKIEVYDLTTGGLIHSEDWENSTPIQTITINAEGQLTRDNNVLDLMSIKNSNAEWQTDIQFNRDGNSLLEINRIYKSLPSDPSLSYSGCIYAFQESSICIQSDTVIGFDFEGRMYSFDPLEDGQLGLYTKMEEPQEMLSTISEKDHVLSLYILKGQTFLIYETYQNGYTNFAIHLWSIPENRTLQHWPGYISASAFSSSGRYLAMIIAKVQGRGEYGNYFLVYDLEEKNVVYREDVAYSYGEMLAFSADEKSVFFLFPNNKDASEKGWQLRIHDVDTRSAANSYILDLPIQSYDYRSPTALALSPDTKLLAIATRGGQIYLHNADNGEIVYQWPAHRDGIKRLLFSPDGRMLMSASKDRMHGNDGTVRMWGILEQ
jgi:WD40 repeat protein